MRRERCYAIIIMVFIRIEKLKYVFTTNVAMKYTWFNFYGRTLYYTHTTAFSRQGCSSAFKTRNVHINVAV